MTTVETFTGGVERRPPFHTSFFERIHLPRGMACLLLPALALVGVAFLYPVGAMLSRSVTEAPGGFSHYRELFGTSLYTEVLVRSLTTAFVATVVSLAIGYPYAYLAATTGPTARRILLMIIGGSLFISIIVRSYSWLAILDRNGALNTWLGAIGLDGLRTTLVHNSTGVVIGLVQYGVPFMVLPLYDNMRRFDERLRRASATLGAPPTVTFLRVYFPLTLPGVVAGSVIVFISTLGYYIIPAILGGPGNTMIGQLIATEIRSTVNWGLGAAISTLLLAVSIVAFVVFYRATARFQGTQAHA
jgi:putative spermidine/putrescine transport system permease protein